MSNHPIHASIDILCHKIDELLEAWKLDYIYVATEDESYCKYLKERYGDRVTFTDQERYSIEPGGMLSHMHARQGKKRDGFLPGVEYILSYPYICSPSAIRFWRLDIVAEWMKLYRKMMANMRMFMFLIWELIRSA